MVGTVTKLGEGKPNEMLEGFIKTAVRETWQAAAVADESRQPRLRTSLAGSNSDEQCTEHIPTCLPTYLLQHRTETRHSRNHAVTVAPWDPAKPNLPLPLQVRDDLPAFWPKEQTEQG